MTLYFNLYHPLTATTERKEISNVNSFLIEPIRDNKRVLQVRFTDNIVKCYTLYDWQVISGDLNDEL